MGLFWKEKIILISEEIRYLTNDSNQYTMHLIVHASDYVSLALSLGLNVQLIKFNVTAKCIVVKVDELSRLWMHTGETIFHFHDYLPSQLCSPL